MVQKKMRKVVLRGSLLVAFLFVLSMACFAQQFEGGRGSEEDPWQIRTAVQLNNVREYLGDEHRDKHFILIEDINLDERPFNEEQGWEPIGSDERGFFCGTFDGGRYKITNLMIRGEQEFLGFFGSVRGAKIRNVGLKDINVTGTHFVGGLVARVIGEGETIIQRCYTTGTVTGNNMVGGMIGVTHGPELIIEDCYSVANVTYREDRAGGLIAEFEEGRVYNCYSIGAMLSDHDPHEGMGAVIGMAHGGELRGLKFCPEYSGVDWAVGNRPDEFHRYSPEEMMIRETYNEYHFEDVWNIRETRSFPYFQWQGEEPEDHNYPPELPPAPPSNLRATAGDQIVDLIWDGPPDGLERPDGYNVYRDERIINEELVTDIQYHDEGLDNFVRYAYKVTAVYGEIETISTNIVIATPYSFVNGTGTEEDPFQISTAEELDRVRYFNSHFIQIADIDLGVAPWNEGEGWIPIGSVAEPFAGTFNGNGFIISNLTINRISSNNALFGRITGAVLDNIHLRDVSITNSRAETGALASYIYNNTVIKNCSSTGEITINTLTDRHIGGLVGDVVNSLVTDSYSHVNITGGERAGGLAGWLNGGHAKNSFATGHLNVNGVSGGLVGLIQTWGTGQGNGTITNCYARGSVTGASQIGGLVGTVTLGGNIIENSYSTGRIVGLGGGLIGQSNAGEVCVNSYWDTETSEKTESPGGALGRLTRQMVYPYDLNEVFVRWGFQDIWMEDRFQINDGYPMLYYQEFEFLASPSVTIEITEDNNVMLSWEAIEDANSYKVFAINNPYAEEWEQITVTADTQYSEPANDIYKRFYQVVASSDEMP